MVSPFQAPLPIFLAADDVLEEVSLSAPAGGEPLAGTLQRAQADEDVLADAEAQVRTWSPSTRRTYGAAWRHFSRWCEEQGVPTLPAAPRIVARFLEDLVELQGRTLATARIYLAAIAANYKLDGQPDPTERPLVRATLKRLARGHGRPRRQAVPLTAEALAAVRATVRTPREHHNGRRWRERGETAERRALVDLALI